MINCIAVDDEPLALDLLEGFIKKIPYLNLKGRFEHTQEALLALKRTEISLIFLDINMPDLNGIQFLKTLTHPPLVIFTTAYESYALEGFELNAVDYLLKPFSFERLLQSTNRVLDLVSPKDSPATSSITDDYIFVRTEHNTVKIKTDQIQYVEGLKDYVKIFASEPKPIFTIKSMKSMDKILRPLGFIRVHRSYIVSIDKIHSVRNGRIRMKDKTIPIGQSYRDHFDQVVIKGKI